MDGSSAKIFLSDRLEWPTGLSLDLPAKRVYWADTKQRSINSISMDGSQRTMILSRFTSPIVDYPFSIDVFEDYLYGVTWRSNILFKMNKFGKGIVELIASDLKILDGRGLRVLQDQKHIIPKGMPTYTISFFLGYKLMLLQCIYAYFFASLRTSSYPMLNFSCFLLGLFIYVKLLVP